LYRGPVRTRVDLARISVESTRTVLDQGPIECLANEKSNLGDDPGHRAAETAHRNVARMR